MIVLKTFRLILLIVTIVAIGGCSNMAIKNFESSSPKFILEEYFQGKTEASGIFEDRFGVVRKQFVVSIVVVVPFTVKFPDSVRFTPVAVPVKAGAAKVA